MVKFSLYGLIAYKVSFSLVPPWTIVSDIYCTRSLTDGLGRLDHGGAVRHVRVQFGDEDEDDGDQEEEVGDDGADAGDLVDPVVGHVGHPAAAKGDNSGLTQLFVDLNCCVSSLF